jgi:hypothetical protein
MWWCIDVLRIVQLVSFRRGVVGYSIVVVRDGRVQIPRVT